MLMTSAPVSVRKKFKPTVTMEYCRMAFTLYLTPFSFAEEGASHVVRAASTQTCPAGQNTLDCWHVTVSLSPQVTLHSLLAKQYGGALLQSGSSTWTKIINYRQQHIRKWTTSRVFDIVSIGINCNLLNVLVLTDCRKCVDYWVGLCYISHSATIVLVFVRYIQRKRTGHRGTMISTAIQTTPYYGKSRGKEEDMIHAWYC